MKYSSSIITASFVKVVGFIGVLIDERNIQGSKLWKKRPWDKLFYWGFAWLDGIWFEMVIGGL